MAVRRSLLKILPYCASIIFGLLFLFIGLELNQDLKGLFISIAAAFLAIPLIYLFYQQANNFSQKRLNKEIFDYAKMKIDTDVLSIVNQLQKTIYPLIEKDFSPAGVSKFLSLKTDDIKKIISANEYLGFQVFKKWEVSENNLHTALQNSYMLKSFENEQIISIISIIKSLRNLESIQKFSELYIPADRKTTSFSVISGRDINEENIQFPERYVLLKNLADNKSLVVDFGDFAAYNRNRLLQIFVINEKLRDIYIAALSDLIEDINVWLDLTGGEFVVDTKMFRVGYKIETKEISKQVM